MLQTLNQMALINESVDEAIAALQTYPIKEQQQKPLVLITQISANRTEKYCSVYQAVVLV